MSNKGWICPRCEKVWAPHVDSCECTGEITIRWTGPVQPAPVAPSWPSRYPLPEFIVSCGSA